MPSSWKKVRSIQAAKLLVKFNRGPATFIIDARSKGSFFRGHLPDASHIDPLHFSCDSLIKKLPVKGRFLVYCRTSRRSDLICQKLQKTGGRDIIQISDGYTGWRLNDLPIVKS